MIEVNHVQRIVPQSPDESLLDAIGNQHTFETAIADLIDNSIQHAGTIISIQLITNDARLVRLRVVDNGRGMGEGQLEEAMQLRKKVYPNKSLSFFGMGMKMASLSQSASLRVFTRNEDGGTFGAQMRRKDAGGRFNTEILNDAFALEQYESFRRENPGSGTVVEWQKIDDVSISKLRKEREKWLADKIKSLQRHFSLVFHRFLGKGAVSIFIEIWDESSQQVGSRSPVVPVDPFDFRSPILGYPAVFAGRTPSKARVELVCTIVPPGSESDSVRLGGATLEALSGLYVYRHDRLIQIAGWQELTNKKSKDLQYCRIRIELTDDLIENGFKLTAEKTAVKLTEDAKKAILSAKCPALGKDFERYLMDAEALKRSSSRRNLGLQPTLRVEGLENAILRNSVQQLIGFKAGGDSLTIVSVALNHDQVFEMDLDHGELRINALLFEEGGPLDSETGYEFFKATLYFLLEPHFTKSALNKSTLAKIEQMHRVLAVALGIQSLETNDASLRRAPTPAVIAAFEMPSASVRPVVEVEDSFEIAFRPSWSSEGESNDPKSIQALARGWRSKPAVEIPNAQNTDDQPKILNKQQGAPAAFLSDPGLAKLGLETMKAYKRSHDIASIAIEIDRSENEITAMLAQLVLGFEGQLDNRDEAFMAGEPFNSTERERLISKYRDGQGLARLSSETGRTCLHIAKEILDSPSFQGKVSSDLIKRLGDVSKG